MRLYFICDGRFWRAKDGNVYSQGFFTSSLWRRYLKIFESVTVVGRLAELPEGQKCSPEFLCTQEGVSFSPLPYYVGPRQFLKVMLKYRKALKKICLENEDSAFLLRVPSNAGNTASKILKRAKKKFAVEVVGDPWDVFSPRASESAFRPFWRIWGVLNLRSCVKRASASCFVTKQALQRRYPPIQGTYTCGLSDVELPPDAFASQPRQLSKQLPHKIIAIGSLAQPYKSPDIVLRVLKKLVDRGQDVELQWCGDGRYKDRMIKLSQKLKVENRAKFLGHVSPTKLRELLDGADVCVHLSRMDGLPRAVVEAMAKGLPVVGSRIGGIPEVLDKEFVVPVEAVDLPAQKVEQLLSSPALYEAQSERNMKTAREVLREQETGLFEEFLREVKKLPAM